MISKVWKSQHCNCKR